MPREPLYQSPMKSSSITMPIEIWGQLRRAGIQYNTTASEIIRTVLTEYMDEVYPDKCPSKKSQVK